VRTHNRSVLGLVLILGPAAINSLMPLFSQQGYQSFRKTVRTEISLGSNRITANEGDTVVMTLNTKNIRSGTRFTYTVTGITQADLSAGSLTGTVTVVNNSATIAFTIAEDVTFLEGPESLNITMTRVDYEQGRPNPPVQGITVPVADTSREITGEELFTTVGAWVFTVPAGVTRISMVCVGAGGKGGTYRVGSYYRSAGGGGGGGLGWKNSVSVTPGEQLTVEVGSPIGGTGHSRVLRGGVVLCAGYRGGDAPTNDYGQGVGGTYTGDGGGRGGDGGYANSSVGSGGAGGGAGGYTGAGGAGGGRVYSKNLQTWVTGRGGAGAGGSAGGGNSSQDTGINAGGGGGGGGVGLEGEGNSASARGVTRFAGGYGGSGGLSGGNSSSSRSGAGGRYGGGGGGGDSWSSGSGSRAAANFGGQGAVRIIWPGNRRRFPSTYAAAADVL